MKYLMDLKPGDWIIHIEKHGEHAFKLWGKKVIDCTLKSRGTMSTDNGPLPIYAFSGNGLKSYTLDEEYETNLYHTVVTDNVIRAIRNKTVEFIYDGMDSIISNAHEINVNISKENPGMLDIIHMIEEETLQSSDNKIKINFD